MEKTKKRACVIVGIVVALSIFFSLNFQPINAFLTNYFNNTLSNETLEFTTAGQNITRYLDLPIRANVTGAYLNFSSDTVITECYQETANVSTACGGLGTGVYTGAMTYDISTSMAWMDENYSTYGAFIFGEGNESVYINYSKPLTNCTGAIWQIKAGTAELTNFTLPDSCFVYYPNTIALRLLGHRNVLGTNYYTADCFNGDWLNVTQQSGATVSVARVYEESIFWNIPSNSLNPSLEIGTIDNIKEWWLPQAELKNIEGVVTKFPDNSLIKNLTFTSNQNLTINLKIPSKASINTAFVNVSGFNPAGQCYQESVNVSTSCGALGTGTYSYTTFGDCYFQNEAYDGQWDDYMICTPDKECAVTYDINVTKNPSATSVIWTISPSPYVAAMQNITLPDSCFSVNENYIYLKIIVNGTNSSTKGYCYNGSWVNVINIDASLLSEEALIWNFSSYPTNVTLSINTSQVYNYTGTFNQINNRTSSFAGTLNSYLSTCTSDLSGICNVSLMVHSDSWGILSLSDLSLNYTNISKTLNLASGVNNALNNSQCSKGTVSGSRCIIPFEFHSDSPANLTYSDFQINWFTLPNVTLSSPANATSSSVTKSFFCNVTDDIGLSNTTFMLWNSTGSVINDSSFVTEGFSNNTNINITFGATDTYKWNCFATNNESYSAYADSNFTLFVDISNPAITLNSPNNNQWFKNGTNININCTVEGANLDSLFLYGNFTGTFAKNRTKTGIVSGTTNQFVMNISDNNILWTCAANKTNDGTITYSQMGNYTFGVDTILPAPNITSVTSSIGDRVFTFAFQINELNLNTCKYKIWNETYSSSNISISPCTSPVATAQVPAFGSYNLTLYAADLASNENYYTSYFTISETAGVTVTGGGGGGESTLPVVGIDGISSNKTYSDLDREIIYSVFFNLCSQKSNTQPCQFSGTELAILESRIKEKKIILDKGDISKLYSNYLQNKLFQGYETKTTIDKYSLIASILGRLTQLQINPPSIDKPYIIMNPSGGEYTIYGILVSNLPIKTCDVIVGGKNLNCSISGTKISVSYKMESTNFTSQIFSGVINVVTDASADKSESKKIGLTFRVYNIYYLLKSGTFWGAIAGTIALIIVVIYALKHSKKRRES